MLWCSSCKSRLSCYNSVDLRGVIPLTPLGLKLTHLVICGICVLWNKHPVIDLSLSRDWSLLNWYTFSHFPCCSATYLGVTFSPSLLTLSLLLLWSPSLNLYSLWCACIAEVLKSFSHRLLHLSLSFQYSLPLPVSCVTLPLPILLTCMDKFLYAR